MPGGTPFLTRAGSFVPDGQGNLVNAAGFYLMGYNLENGPPTVVANGLTGLEVVNIGQTALEGNPSTQATASANLDANAAITAGAPAYTSKDVARHLRQYRQQGDSRHLHVQDGGQHLGYARCTITPMRRLAAFPIRARRLDSDTFTFDVSATGKGRLDCREPDLAHVHDPGRLGIHARSLGHDAGCLPISSSRPTVDGNAPSAIEKVEVDDRWHHVCALQ